MGISVNSENDFWVFAYGSLMWRPGFDYVECKSAKLYGHHRAFCVFSYYHRGTPEHPGLVLGLERGGSCRGLAYRVRGSQAEAVRDYLRAREQVTMIYLEVMGRVHILEDVLELSGPRERKDALCFIVDRKHEQYAGKLSFDEQVHLIARGKGRSGENPEYLANTLQHLEEMGIADEGLKLLWRAVSQVREHG